MAKIIIRETWGNGKLTTDIEYDVPDNKSTIKDATREQILEMCTIRATYLSHAERIYDQTDYPHKSVKTTTYIKCR